MTHDHVALAIKPMVEAYRLWATSRMDASMFGSIADKAVIAYDNAVRGVRVPSADGRQLYEMTCDPVSTHEHPSGTCFSLAEQVPSAEGEPPTPGPTARLDGVGGYPLRQPVEVVTDAPQREPLTVERFTALLDTAMDMPEHWDEPHYNRPAICRWLLPRLGALPVEPT